MVQNDSFSILFGTCLFADYSVAVKTAVATSLGVAEASLTVSTDTEGYYNEYVILYTGTAIVALPKTITMPIRSVTGPGGTTNSSPVLFTLNDHNDY